MNKGKIMFNEIMLCQFFSLKGTLTRTRGWWQLDSQSGNVVAVLSFSGDRRRVDSLYDNIISAFALKEPLKRELRQGVFSLWQRYVSGFTKTDTCE
jgi:hypothetical protein